MNKLIELQVGDIVVDSCGDIFEITKTFSNDSYNLKLVMENTGKLSFTYDLIVRDGFKFHKGLKKVNKEVFRVLFDKI